MPFGVLGRPIDSFGEHKFPGYLLRDLEEQLDTLKSWLLQIESKLDALKIRGEGIAR